MTRETLLRYIAAILAVAVAGAMAVNGRYAQASVLAAGAAFLIYWNWRQQRDQGDQ